MKLRTHRSFALIGVAVAALVASACGGDDGNSITVYSGRGNSLIQPIIDRFEEESGIDVKVKYGDSADLALLINEEADAGRAEADVYLSQSPGSIGFVDANLAQIPQATLDLVDPNTRDDDGRWVGISGRQRVLVYNTDDVDPAELPDSIFDLVADDRWAGEIGVAGGNGSFQDFVTAMRFTEGEDVAAAWLSDLAALDPVAYANNNAIVTAVGRGDVQVGLVNHYYNFRQLAENPDQPSANHVFADGDPGATLIVTGAAIVAGSDKADLADQFLQFLLSDEGQQYFANETFEYPLVPGQPTAGNVPPIEFGDVGSIDLDELEGGLGQTRAMIEAAGLES
ncbi:extracellular solute-binding protein [Ilumatobacter coccineus]|uniref:Putative iron(III) ABC transporter iron(III)-binding protein n=1 Tax=Ilumatobacter coccineus (strain NBRC 103263 / KCTC 29153 / YM16-304) TaxID=1313172 RepID=A0A6C7E5W0_ILUCY|nr:extracellular solute-binding protein [Ilumatobacter coccineus]BAN01833.1 putative iron(III) ABC transporter iron(III)-binding protein [Ilumatobacter coccineus YM16-304]